MDALLLSHSIRSSSVQNLGGIANVTFLPPTSEKDVPIAFDTGPGNMLIDAIVGCLTNGELTYDSEGTLAAQGKVDELILADLMADPYLKMSPPKTTGRERFGLQFGEQFWRRYLEQDRANVNLLATVTSFTTRSIAHAYEHHWPAVPDDVIVSGGGTANRTLMSMLTEVLPASTVCPSNDLGLPADAKEAIAFAVLAHETRHGRLSNLPSVTGANRPVILGSITPG